MFLSSKINTRYKSERDSHSKQKGLSEKIYMKYEKCIKESQLSKSEFAETILSRHYVCLEPIKCQALSKNV